MGAEAGNCWLVGSMAQEHIILCASIVRGGFQSTTTQCQYYEQ